MSELPPPPPLPPPGVLCGPPPPPPPPGGGVLPEFVANLPQFNIPKPRSRMKTFQWQKIPANNVIGKSNLWTIISHLENKYEMDYEKMDELFSLNQDSRAKISNRDSDGIPDSKKKKDNAEGADSHSQINILDGKRSLNVNIFLKHFRMEHAEIVGLIREGRCDKLGAERLKSLLKLLPSQEEIDAINAFDGDLDRLGNAEKFFICLMKLPNFRMRIEGLVIMEEFNINMEWIRPSIEAVIQAAKDIQESQSLKELIYLILISGNYLNSGNYAGNAAGFQLSSLLKLTEIRANRPGMNLLHYVALEAEMNNPKLLKFPDEMKFLKDASQVAMETLTSDINNITSKVRAISQQMNLAGVDFQQQMAPFLKEANLEVCDLEEDLKDIEMIRVDLATFFCEDIKNFKLEECFKIIQTFCERLKKATEENIKRRIQEIKAERREMENSQSSRAIVKLQEQEQKNNESSLVDRLLADVHRGYASTKLKDGNFSVTKVKKVSLSTNDVSAITDMLDGAVSPRKKSYDSSVGSPVDSPFSPADSLAQRRSRRSVNRMDDESLLEFLMETPEPEKPETRFERYSSLRRRRLERKDRRSSLKVFEMERERIAASPNMTDIKQPSTDTTVSSVKMRHLSNATRDRPKSEVFSDSRDTGFPLRRSQSLLDKSLTGTEQRRASLQQDNEDESDALIRRLKQKLNRKNGRDTPTIDEEADNDESKLNQTIFPENLSPMKRNVSRWRSGITVSETISSSEQTSNNNSMVKADLDDSVKTLGTSQEKISNQFDYLDATQQAYHLQDGVSSPPSVGIQTLQDTSESSPGVPLSVSLRKQISSTMGTDIDVVLKTIEDSGRQIDTVGVSGPIKRVPEPAEASPHVAIVAHVTASSSPQISKKDMNSKKTADKNIALLTVDKAKPTRIFSDSRKDIKRVNNTNTNLSRTRSTSSIRRSTSKQKTPPPPPQVRLCKSRNHNHGEDHIACHNDQNNKKDLEKLAGKQKFREARFGGSSVRSNSRTQSSVDSKNVEQAVKEVADQSSVNRSKSFSVGDIRTHMDNQPLGNNGTSDANNTDSTSTLVIKRIGANKLSTDGRRNGLCFLDNERDTAFLSDNHELSKCNSSDDVFNTSAETLTEDGSARVHESSSYLHSNNHINRNNFDEEDDNPLAAVANWRMKRTQQRKSTSDILNDSEGALTSNTYLTTRSQRLSHSSIERDEGFETASGATSQRTSMNSAVEAEIHNNLALKASSVSDNQFNGKVRVECWTEQTVNINDESSDSLSPYNEHKSSKEDRNIISSPIKPKDVKKTVTVNSNVKSNKQSVPGYMLPTNSSSSKPTNSRASLSSSTDAIPSATSITRGTPIRASVRDQENTPALKRNSVRASMKGETSNTGFQRGTNARTSVRGPRTSLHSVDSSKSLLTPSTSPGKSKSELSSSISSLSSSISNSSATPSNVIDTTRRRLATTLNSGEPIHHPATPSGRSTTPSGRPTTPSLRPNISTARPNKPASRLTPSAIRHTTSAEKTTSAPSASAKTASSSQNSNIFTRTQSVRVVSTHASLANENKGTTGRSVTPQPQNTKRTTTPLPNENSRSTTLQERPHSTTPMMSESKSIRRSSFMAPTASSRAKKDEQASTAAARPTSATSSTTTHGNLRGPKISGRRSPANGELLSIGKPEHYQSLSTVAEQIAGEDQEAGRAKNNSIIRKVISKTKVLSTGSKVSSKTVTKK